MNTRQQLETWCIELVFGLTENVNPIYGLLTYYGIFTLTTLGMKTLVFGITNMDNMRIFVHCIRAVIAQYAPLTRMICALVYRKEFVYLDKELGSVFDDKLKNEKNRPALLKKVSLYSKFMNFYNSSTFLTAFLYFLPYAIKIFKDKKNVQIWMVRFLWLIGCYIHKGKYPFPVEPRGVVYWIIIAFETSVFWYSFHGLSSIDCAFGLHCFRLSGLIRLATERIRNLNANDFNCINQLKECVTIHQQVIRAKIALQKAYGFIIVWTYVTIALVMCSLLWQIDQMKSQISMMRLSFIIFYMSLKIVQVFIYAYYGSTITTESEYYQDAVYASSWAGSGNVRFMKDLLIVLMQRNVTLRACGYFMMTMEFFDKICNTTISFFFLLHSLDAQH